MDTIETNIMEYEQGILSVRARIEWLSGEINKARAEGHAIKEQLDRRYLLYCQLADMQYSLGCLRDYRRELEKQPKSNEAQGA